MSVETDEKGTYIFSSKDLCLIKEIPEIIDMGVSSLKIEGRLKTEMDEEFYRRMRELDALFPDIPSDR